MKIYIISSLIVFWGLLLASADNIKINRDCQDDAIFCLAQSSNGGPLWVVARERGLFYYDGYDEKKIKTKITRPTVWSLIVDKEETVWFFIENYGLCSYSREGGIYKEYKSTLNDPHSLSSNNYHRIPNTMSEDKEGLIWVGTINGLNSVDKKTDKIIQYKHNPADNNSLSCNDIWVVFIDSKNNIWIGTEDGLNCYDKNIKKFTCYKHNLTSGSLSDNHIRSIAEDKKGNIWIGTKNTGIDKFNPTTKIFTNYIHNPNDFNTISCNMIHQIMIDRFDNLWICNEGGAGLDRYDQKTNTFYHYSDNPSQGHPISSNNVFAAMEDRSGNIWVLDNTEYINKCILQNNFLKIFAHKTNDPSSISSNNLTKLYEDKKGNIWIGTNKNGLCLYTKDDKFKNFSHIDSNSSSLPDNSVYSILGNIDSTKLWLGINGGFICLFDINNKYIIKTFKNPYSQNAPYYLTQDNKEPNTIWFVSLFNCNLFKLDTISGKFFQYSSITTEDIINIFQDDNVLWLGTEGDGLIKFDKMNGTSTHYRYNPKDKRSISGNIVVESFIDSRGQFWITTDDGGLNKFEPETGYFTSYGKEFGFTSNSTRHILEDKDGYLWLTTESRLIKFDTKKLRVTKMFTKTDSLPEGNFNKLVNPLKDSNGNFWFSTFGGLLKFNPEEINKIALNQHIPFINLSSFKSKEGTYNENGTKILKSVTLPSSDNSFEFTFAVLDYLESSENRYAYMLEGFDNSWNYIGKNHAGRYSNLNPGKYVLKIKGANNDGIWNEEGISVNIEITPPYWKTWWFRGLSVIILLTLIFGIFQIRTRALRKKAKLLEDYNTELKKEIEERKRAETERNKAEQERREVEEKLRKTELAAQRDHAIAEITSKVGHDVRKPFNYLKTMLHVLPMLTPKQTQEYSEELDIVIRKVEALLADLMEVSREKPYDLTPANIISVLDLSIKDISRLYPDKKVNFFYDFDTVQLVNLDENRMCRAFENIISNAFDCLPNNDGIMWFSSKIKNRKAEIIIGNSHSCIPEDKLDEIFEKSFTLGKKGGTGLGLSIVSKVVNGHNGSIFARNVKKLAEIVPENLKHISGVEFVITLPLTKEPGYNLKDPLLKNSEEAKGIFGMVQKKNQLAGSSLIDTLLEKLKKLPETPNLLILDDESIYRMRVRDVIANMGEIRNFIHAYDASNYREANEIINQTKIDYLICDIDLGEKNYTGFSVLSKAINKNPDCRVLMHTNRKEPKDIKEAQERRACGFCPKPITEAILVDLLMNKELWQKTNDSKKDFGIQNE